MMMDYTLYTCTCTSNYSRIYVYFMKNRAFLVYNDFLSHVSLTLSNPPLVANTVIVHAQWQL